MCVCVCVYEYIYTYIYIHTHTHIHTYIHTYIHTFMYRSGVCVFVRACVSLCGVALLRRVLNVGVEVFACLCVVVCVCFPV